MSTEQEFMKLLKRIERDVERLKRFDIPLGAPAGVTTDATLTGDGTAGDPLGVVVDPSEFYARLSLSETDPCPSADITNATVLYILPYKGNKIALYNTTTSGWGLSTVTSGSAAVPNTADTVYDVFAYDNAGAVEIELTAWTNITTRATALTTQNGIYVKTGDASRRYAGTIATSATQGKFESSEISRRLYNYYNRIARMSKVFVSTAHTYSTSAYREFNNAACRIYLLSGVSEEPVFLSLSGAIQAGADNINTAMSVGYNSTSSGLSVPSLTNRNAYPIQLASTGYHQMPIGLHYYAVLEYGNVIAGTFGNGSVQAIYEM